MRTDGRYRILIAIETDATRYHGENASRPLQLSHSDAEQMLAHVAADLAELLPAATHCTLICAGALFDQTQILRPVYPVFGALESLLSGATDPVQSPGIKPRLISLGTENGRIPVDELVPEEGIPIGILQVLPLLVAGPEDVVTALGQEMEHRFMDQGQLSAHTANWMESAFGVAINHARFMTLTDLNAMFRMQLEHFGFLPLWELIDAALTADPEPRQVATDQGLVFRWRSGSVHTTFETFNYWSSQGGGSQIAAHRQLLAGGYAAWTRELRRYVTTLGAHAVPIEFDLPQSNIQKLTGTYCVEQAGLPDGSGWASITEHSLGDLGTVAVTVVSKDEMSHFFPLSADGLNEIHRDIRTPGNTRPLVAFPGSILYDEKTRNLRPDSS